MPPSPCIDLCAARYQHLSDLDLADSSSDTSNMEVDMLIGSNYYTGTSSQVKLVAVRAAQLQFEPD